MVAEPVLEPVAATGEATAVGMVVVMLGVTVLAMAAVTAAVLLPARATTTAGKATWSAPVVVPRSLHPAASIDRVQQPGVSPVRRLETLIRVVAWRQASVESEPYRRLRATTRLKQ